jgi:hypothetical protein
MGSASSPKAFDNILASIYGNEDGGTINMKVRLYSGTLGDYETVLARPLSLRIIQDFLVSYTDHILLMLELTTQQFMEIMENTTDLKIRLTLTYKDYTTGTEKNEIFSRSYKALIRNMFKMNQFFSMDQLKKMATSQVDLIPIQFELIDETIYDLRKREINFIARDVTVEDVILLSAEALGIDRIHLVTPDNTRLYEQIIVPPMQTLKTLFKYLQDTPSLGVYETGCNYYYTNETLYVWPKWNLEPEKGTTAHFYNTATYDMIASPNRHYLDAENGDIHVAVPTVLDIENKVQSGIENERTGRVFYKSEMHIDERADTEYREENDKKKDKNGRPKPVLLFAEEAWGAVGKELDIAMTETTHAANAMVKRSDDNPYSQMSRIAEQYCNRMALQWDNALPFAMTPSFPVTFHYDLTDLEESTIEEGDFVVQTIPCLCEKVVYDIVMSDQHTAFGDLYYCTGKVQLATDALNT